MNNKKVTSPTACVCDSDLDLDFDMDLDLDEILICACLCHNIIQPGINDRAHMCMYF